MTTLWVIVAFLLDMNGSTLDILKSVYVSKAVCDKEAALVQADYEAAGAEFTLVQCKPIPGSST